MSNTWVKFNKQNRVRCLLFNANSAIFQVWHGTQWTSVSKKTKQIIIKKIYSHIITLSNQHNDNRLTWYTMNSFKFMDTNFRGVRKECIFADSSIDGAQKQIHGNWSLSMSGMICLRTCHLRPVPLVGQELPTVPENLSSSPIISGVRVTRSWVLCVCFVYHCLSFCHFFCCPFVLSVLLRFTDSDYPFSIFKLLYQMFDARNRSQYIYISLFDTTHKIHEIW